MHPSTIELMHEHVRTIYRAATGAELGEGDASATEQAPPDEGEVERRFAELEALARQNPAIDERVPPFSFTPLVDLIDAGSELVVELAAPGVEREDVEVEALEHELLVSGVRRGGRASNGCAYLHAEIPRGPFSRVIALPCTVEPHVNLDVRNGVILIRLRKL
jgi:HSP20 family molecular chaperone IbpA